MDFDGTVGDEIGDLLAPGETPLAHFPVVRHRAEEGATPDPQRTLVVTSHRLLLTTLDPDVLLDPTPRVVRHRSMLLGAVLGVTWESVPLQHNRHSDLSALPSRSTLTVTTAYSEVSWTLEGHDAAQGAQRAVVAAMAAGAGS